MKKLPNTYLLFITMFPIFLFSVPSTSHSASYYYVDYQLGSDQNEGFNISNPLKTVPSNLSPGDVVYLKRGVTYGTTITQSNSGTLRVTATDGSHTSNSTTFTSSSGNFINNGVTAGTDTIFINGEGIFSISSVDSTTTLTLATPPKHTNTSVAYSIILPIKITIDTAWGTGNAVVTGNIDINGNATVVDGVIDNGIEIRGGKFPTSGTTSSDIFAQYLYIHDVGGNSPGVFFGNHTRGLIAHSTIKNIGTDDGVTGDDGVGVSSSSSYITLDNLVIDNTKDDGIQFAACDECYIQNSTISNCTAPTVHADGIAMNSGGTAMDVIIRYNYIHDNASSSDIEAAIFVLYGNIFWDTVPNWPGNIGWRYKRGACGEIYNNIFGYQTINAIKAYSDACTPSKIKNNIFYENDDRYVSGGQEISIGATAGGELDYNIYIRKEFSVSSDKIIGWGGTKTLAEAQAAGLETNGLKCTAAGCDWTWNIDDIFLSRNRNTPIFTPASPNSPQVGAGTNLGILFDYSGKPIPSNNVDIGAVQYSVSSSDPRPSPPLNLQLLY